MLGRDPTHPSAELPARILSHTFVDVFIISLISLMYFQTLSPFQQPLFSVVEKTNMSSCSNMHMHNLQANKIFLFLIKTKMCNMLVFFITDLYVGYVYFNIFARNYISDIANDIIMVQNTRTSRK